MDKFAVRVIPSIFIGYASLQKGYKLFSMHTKEFMISRDVAFHDHIFPFQHMDHNVSSIFSVLHLLEVCDTSPPLVVSVDSFASDFDHVLPHMPIMESASSNTTSQTPTLRRSSRTSRPSIWLQDFHTTSLSLVVCILCLIMSLMTSFPSLMVKHLLLIPALLSLFLLMRLLVIHYGWRP